MMLIGMYGDSRSGKDTTAGILVSEHGFEKRNMADPIRAVLLLIDPEFSDPYKSKTHRLSALVQENGWDWVKKNYPDSVDQMIALGQGMRDIDQDVWLNACTKESYVDLCIADVRQPNEAIYIAQHGGELWHIIREGTTKRGMDGLLDDWEFDVEIHNNGTIEALANTVALIMGKSMNE